MKERRRHPRYPISVVFDFIDGEPELEGQQRGAILNLSQSGALLESEAFMDAGQRIEFEISAPIQVWAKIVRVKKEGVRTQYGVQFDKVKLLDRFLLRRLLRQEQLKSDKKKRPK